MRFIGTILLLVVLSIYTKSFACSCKFLSVKQAVKAADVIVVGTILNKQKFVSYDSAGSRRVSKDTSSTFRLSHKVAHLGFVYDLKVEHVYKGKLENDTIRVYSGQGMFDCGFPFQIGEKYIVLGSTTGMRLVKDNHNYSEGIVELWTGHCSRTTSYLQAETDKIEKYSRRFRR